jgi:hypothetical protein
MWFLPGRVARLLGQPSHRSLHWPSAARLGWPVAATLAVFYAGGHLVLARGSLSVAERAVRAHRDYAVGTYAPESTPGGGEFRWTRADARISLRNRSRVAVTRSWVAHPDAAVRPDASDRDALSGDLGRGATQRTTGQSRLWNCRMTALVLLDACHAWRPSDQGDRYQERCGLTADFVDSLGQLPISTAASDHAVHGLWSVAVSPT